jgi:hypothetical protein
VRRDEDAEAGSVDEMHGNEPVPGKLLGPGADAAEMAGVADGRGADPVALDPVGGEIHSLAADHLAVAEAAVDDEERPKVGDGLGMAVRREMARAHPTHVLHDPDYAVRVVALQIGFDQVIGDDLGFLLRRARRREDARREVAQPLGDRCDGPGSSPAPRVWPFPHASREIPDLAAVQLGQDAGEHWHEGLGMPLCDGELVGLARGLRQE